MNNPIEGLEGLPDAQKNALMTQIEEMQVRDRRAQLQPACFPCVSELQQCAWRLQPEDV